MTKTCPIDFIHLEAGVEPIADRLRKNDDLTWDRYARLESHDPRNKLLHKTFKERSKPLKTRAGWRKTTAGRMSKWGICREVTTPPIAPWRVLSNLKTDEVPLTKKKSEYSEEELNRITKDKIENMSPRFEVTIYTDGSTNSDQTNGGAGVYAEDKEGNVLLEVSYPAGQLCSSYTGESVAALKALEWIQEKGFRECLIITDSKSLQDALKKNDWRDTDPWLKKIKTLLVSLECIVTILWIPSHIKIHGNDRADELAAAGTRMDQKLIPVTQSIVKAKIKAQKWEVTHERAIKIYGTRRSPRFDIESKWPRDVRRKFQQLRTDHCKELRYYRYLIEKDDFPYCECGTGEEQTLEHVLCRCPALEERRQRQIGGDVTMDMMVSEPEQCRKILEGRIPELKLKRVEEPTGGGHPSVAPRGTGVSSC